MTENFFDLALLNGVVTSILTSKSSSNSIIYDFVYSSESKFLNAVRKIIIHLKKYYKNETLAEKFNLPIYLLKTLINSKSNGGRCLICDKHIQTRVARHLKDFHSMNLECISEYKRKFSKKSFFYMPEEFKKAEEFAFSVYDVEKNYQKFNKVQKMYVNYLTQVKNEPNYTQETFRKFAINPEFEGPVCEFCGKEVNWMNRRNHYDNHRAAEIVECSFCQMRFRRRNLKEHLANCEVAKLNNL